jgi:hypothetical protein
LLPRLQSDLQHGRLDINQIERDEAVNPMIDHRELTNCFSASRSISADSSGSVTIRDIVSAPIIMAAATNALRRATSGRVLPD